MESDVKDALMEELYAEIGRLRSLNSALVSLLRSHRCNADGRQTVGECINGQCGCMCALLIPSEDVETT